MRYSSTFSTVIRVNLDSPKNAFRWVRYARWPFTLFSERPAKWPRSYFLCLVGALRCDVMRRVSSRTARLGCLLLVCAAMLCIRSAMALDPSLDISQYAHTAWKVRDGFATGSILSVAQTPDGYLWVGTELGLFRFDGVHAKPWQAPQGQMLPGNEIHALLAAHDGALWIGTRKGLCSWKNGKLTTYPELAGQDVVALIEDGDGTVWVGGISFPPPGKLCAIRPESVQCYGEDGTFGNGVIGLYGDRRGNVWVGVVKGIWRWSPGPPEFFSLPSEVSGIRAFAEDDDGALLIGSLKQIQRFVNGRVEDYPLPVTWVADPTRAVKTTVFDISDGVRGHSAPSGYAPRVTKSAEGKIWFTAWDGISVIVLWSAMICLVA